MSFETNVNKERPLTYLDPNLSSLIFLQATIIKYSQKMHDVLNFSKSSKQFLDDFIQLDGVKKYFLYPIKILSLLYNSAFFAPCCLFGKKHTKLQA